MNIKTLLSGVGLFFSLHSIQAQDSIKHFSNHKHKVHLVDSAKLPPISHATHFKDTTRTGKEYLAVIPKYPPDGYVAVSKGLGTPDGAFSGAGCASSGSVFSINAAFPGIISHYGIAFKFDDGTNGLNQNQFLGSFSEGVGFTNINYSFVGKVNVYTYQTFLTGLYLTRPGEKITIDFRILGGVMMATIPALAVNMYDQLSGNNGIFYESETSASSFAIDIGMEARYHIFRRLSIILSADYLHSSPSFLLVITGASLTNNGNSTGTIIEETGRQTTGVDQPFSLFNLSLGVGYTITAKN